MLTELKEIEKKALALPKAEKEVLIKNLINRLQDSTLSELVKPGLKKQKEGTKVIRQE